MKRYKQTRGFTLLELLLVITLLTALAVMGIAMYRQKMISIKVEKTALQMQQWLQAGLAYYAEYHHWPEDATDDQFKHYLPVRTEKNPWGKDYKIGTDDEKEGRQVFQVRTEVVPYTRINQTPNTTAIAARVAARLPSAKVVEGKAELYSEVALPGHMLVDQQRIRLMGVYRISVNEIGNYEVPKPTDEECSQQKKVYYSLEGIKFLRDEVDDGRLIGSISVTHFPNNIWKPKLTIHAYYNGISKHHGPMERHDGTVIAIVTCEPNPALTPLQAANTTNNQNYNF